MRQQSFTRIFQYVEHILEALSTSIIGVRHIVDYLVAAEISHAVNLLFTFYVGRFVVQGIDIAVVHT